MPTVRFKTFSLRTFLAAVMIACTSIGWYAVRSQNQRACVAAVIAKGGSVVYRYHDVDSRFDTQSKPPGPKWLRDRLGLDYFLGVYGIELSYQNFYELPDLSKTPGLEVLWLRGTNVTDLSFATKLENLQILWVSDTKIQNLSPISGNKNLRWLSIAGTDVQDLSPLDELPGLRTLNISRTKISPKEIARFRAQNPRCTILGSAN